MLSIVKITQVKSYLPTKLTMPTFTITAPFVWWKLQSGSDLTVVLRDISLQQALSLRASESCSKKLGLGMIKRGSTFWITQMAIYLLIHKEMPNWHLENSRLRHLTKTIIQWKTRAMQAPLNLNVVKNSTGTAVIITRCSIRAMQVRLISTNQLTSVARLWSHWVTIQNLDSVSCP